MRISDIQLDLEWEIKDNGDIFLLEEQHENYFVAAVGE